MHTCVLPRRSHSLTWEASPLLLKHNPGPSRNISDNYSLIIYWAIFPAPQWGCFVLFMKLNAWRQSQTRRDMLQVGDMHSTGYIPNEDLTDWVGLTTQVSSGFPSYLLSTSALPKILQDLIQASFYAHTHRSAKTCFLLLKLQSIFPCNRVTIYVSL